MSKEQDIGAFLGLFKEAKVVDLSYAMEEGMPVWPTHARFSSTPYESYEFGDGSLHSALTFGEHCGTHIDAPKHFIPGGIPVDELPILTVMGQGVKIDASFLAPLQELSKDDIQAFEKEQGEIIEGDIIFLRFGWDEKYQIQPNTKAYLEDWPGLGESGAQYLLDKKVKAVGCDALALDRFGTTDFPSHHLLLGNGIPIIENVCNLLQVPSRFFVFGLPLKVKGGSGSPIRLTAWY